MALMHEFVGGVEKEIDPCLDQTGCRQTGDIFAGIVNLPIRLKRISGPFLGLQRHCGHEVSKIWFQVTAEVQNQSETG